MNEYYRYYAKNNFATTRYIQNINRLYQLSEAEMYAHYEKAFLRVFQRAVRHSPFYIELYAAHGIGPKDIKQLEDIEKLPILTKEMIKTQTDRIYNGMSFFAVK